MAWWGLLRKVTKRIQIKTEMKLDFYRFGSALYLIPTITIHWGWRKAVDITWLCWVLDIELSDVSAERIYELKQK